MVTNWKEWGIMKIKFLIRRLPNIVVYYLTFKKYYLCDECKHIHKVNDDAIELNGKYGLFVNDDCSKKLIAEVCNILSEGIMRRLKSCITN